VDQGLVEATMSLRRFVACFVALAALLLAAPARAADPPGAAVDWLKTQQQSDGGFEVAGFPGFETRDAALAIAEQSQTGSVWNASQARAAVAALHFGGGSGPTPLDALDTFAATITTAGAAAKTIVLTAEPLGFDPAAFDPAGNGSPVNLVAKLDAGCSANSATFGAAFSDTLYAILAKKFVCGATPSNALATVRNAQQANGGWNFSGDNTGTDVDPDTTALALEALVAGGATASDSAAHAALVFFATNQQSSGAWQSFGSDDPNSTSLAILGAGFDLTSSCWRDTVAPDRRGTAYVDPDTWLVSQQQVDGRIASPNDGFGINTFATSQTVEALLRRWLPVVHAPAQTCSTPIPTTTTTPPTTTPPSTTNTATVAGAVVVTPAFTG
jgi:hypothetical protein